MVAQIPALLPPNSTYHFTDKNGQLSNTGRQVLQQIRQATNGLAPVVPCTAAVSSNVYTLTPFTVSPAVANYYDYFGFAFVSTGTSTGAISATVVPQTGTLPTLPVYKNAGLTVAGIGDITDTGFYILHYVDSLNSGNGAFVLTSGNGSTPTVNDHTTSYSLSSQESGNIYTNTGAIAKVTYSLPTAVAGLQYTFVQSNANEFEVLATGSAKIMFDTVLSNANGNIDSTTQGSTATLVAVSSTLWVSTSIVGTWVLT